MAKQNNRTCIICGKNYSYCGNCRGDAGKPSWYFIFDNENCHDIYETCVAYRDKAIDIKEAYERISKLDLSDLDNFAESTKLQIKEILGYKNVVKPTQITEVEAVKVEATETKILSKTSNTKNKNKK